MNKDFFVELQKLAQIEDSGVEVYIDEDGEIEFEIDFDVFMGLLKRENKDQ
jgi:hypothetical protein